MTKQDNVPDWGDLQAMWQHSPALDMDKMARHARFVWWRMRINFALEITVCLIALGFMGHFVWTNPALERLIFGGVVAVFSVFSMWAAFWVRAGAWDSADGTALSLIRLQIERARSAIRYGRINLWTYAACMPILAVGIWVKLKQTPPPTDADIRKILIFCVVYCLAGLVFWALARVYIQRKQSQINDLLDAEAQLQSIEKP